MSKHEPKNADDRPHARDAVCAPHAGRNTENRRRHTPSAHARRGARAMLLPECTGGRHGTGCRRVAHDCATRSCLRAGGGTTRTAGPFARQAHSEGRGQGRPARIPPRDTPQVCTIRAGRKRRAPEPEPLVAAQATGQAATPATARSSLCRAARARRRKYGQRKTTASETSHAFKSYDSGGKHQTELICVWAGIPWPWPMRSTSSRTSKHTISFKL